MTEAVRRVLVTGGRGFIGSHALAALRARGYEVHASSRQLTSSPVADVQWHAADLLDPDAAVRLMRLARPSHLLHFAWYNEHGKYWHAEENFRWVGATLELLRAFADAGGRRAVQAGTCAEYESGHACCDERLTPLQPATLYGICKNATRVLSEAYCTARGLSGAWGRVFHLYGPRENPRRLVAYLANALLADEDALCSHGRQVRDFLHVADAAEAFAALLDSPVTGAINIGSGSAVTIGALAARMAQLSGRPQRLKLGARAPADNDPPELVPVVRRLQEEVGWRPRHDLDSGLLNTLDWWRAHLQTVGPAAA